MRKRRVFALFLAMTMILSSFSISMAGTEPVNAPDESPTFSDVNRHWAKDAIYKWSGYGIVNGFNGLFRPSDSITRGEMAVILDNMMDYQVTADNSFSDLKAGQYYTDSLLKANAAGIILGNGSKIRPADKITREEAAVILGRALAVKEGANGSASFTDAASTSSWAKGYVSAMEAKGYLKGTNNKFNPKNHITRAEIVTIIDNVVKAYYTEAGTYTENVTGTAIIKVSDVTLNGVAISENLIIAEGVGQGNVTLDSVTVKGDTVVRGGGENSVHITGTSSITNIRIEKVDGKIRIAVSDGNTVREIEVAEGEEIIITGTVGTVDVAVPSATINVNNANISNVNISGSDTTLEVGAGSTVGTVTASARTTVSGQGAVTNVTLNAGADNSSVTTPNTQTTVGSGVTGATGGGGTVLPEGSTGMNNSSGNGTSVRGSTPSGGGGGNGGSHDVAVSSISVSPVTMTLTEGGTAGAIIITIAPSNATNKNVTCTSSNTSVATVSAIGSGWSITPLAAGTCTITAISAGDGSKTAACVVTVITLAQANAAAAVEKAEGSNLQADVNDAQDLINALPPGTAKDSLQERLTDVQDIINATGLVESAEASMDPFIFDLAQSAVGMLPDGTVKDALQVRLNALQEIINDIQNATAAVQNAEASYLQADATYAQGLVTDLPVGTAKYDLQIRIDAVQSIINGILAATAIVEVAEASMASDDLDWAQDLVDDLPDGLPISAKSDLQDRITAVHAINQTAADQLAAALDDTALGLPGGQTKTTVQNNLSLTDTTSGGSITVTWASNNTGVIENDGTVHRPGVDGSDQGVTLTATVSVNGKTATKDFEVIVIKSEFAGGEGTLSSPFLVATAGQLDQVRNLPDKHFRQSTVIDLSSSFALWHPISNFTGSYNGDNLVINNLAMTSDEAGANGGLFGNISGAAISNVIIDGIDISGMGYNIGGLAGECINSEISGCAVINGSVSGYQRAGGLIGYMETSVISNCYTSCTVSGITNCAGGLIGLVNNGLDITDCHSTGNVTAERSVGGLIGEINTGTKISHCFATGNVTATDVNGYCSGGLVGLGTSCVIEYCYATGTVSGFYCVGGLAGQTATVHDCYATGNVSGLSRVGGLLGQNGDSVTNCFSANEVTCTGDDGGGMIGFRDYTPSYLITNCYYDETLSGFSTNDKGLSRTTEQLQNGTVNSQLNIDGGATGDLEEIYTGWVDPIWDFTTTDYPSFTE